MKRRELLLVAGALLIGGALWFVVSLEPIWAIAWFVPGLLLVLALKTEGWTSRGLVAIAALLGMASNYRYLLSVMPMWPALLVLLLQSALWVAVFSATRRIVTAYASAWTVLALPVVMVAADTLLAHFTPDGNWGSLAYTQADLLPIVQLASVFGVGGILFLLMLGNSAIALLLAYGRRLRGAATMCLAVLAAIGLTLGFGWWRLGGAQAREAAGTPVSFGIASVDDYLMGPLSEKSRDVWAQYQAQVQALAGSGAQVVLLPEKIDVLQKPDADGRKAWLAEVARTNKVWLVAGLGVVEDGRKRNEAWWFAPDGRLLSEYRKHFMAPPEREFIAGREYPVHDIGGVRYGVAICKDMHFSRLGREFGRRGARVMLVPAWDFDRDADMAANMTRMRGIESGFTVVRSSRQGLLTITDPYGQVLAVARSASLPGTTLFATVKVAPPVATIYTRIGDSLGWACVAAAILWSFAAGWRVNRARIIAELKANPTSAPPAASG
jgi:apolipoprotein N-acyltransferase